MPAADVLGIIDGVMAMPAAYITAQRIAHNLLAKEITHADNEVFARRPQPLPLTQPALVTHCVVMPRILLHPAAVAQHT